MARWSALAAILLLGCDLQPWLAAVGVRSFREVGVEEARRLLDDPGAALIQVRAGASGAVLPNATLVAGTGELPDDLPIGAERLLVVAEDGPAGRRVAAALVREGARRVTLAVAEPGMLGESPPVGEPPGG